MALQLQSTRHASAIGHAGRNLSTFAPERCINTHMRRTSHTKGTVSTIDSLASAFSVRSLLVFPPCGTFLPQTLKNSGSTMITSARKNLLLALCSVWLTSCGGGSSGTDSGSSAGGDSEGAGNASGFGGITTDAAAWGFIDVYDSDGFFLSANATFHRNGSATDAIYRDSIIGPLPALDYCIVEDNAADPNDTIDLTYLSAGGSISVDTKSGAFLTMNRLQFQSFVSYTHSQMNQNTVVPAGLSASFPGDDVPAMSDLVFPDIDTLTGVTQCGLVGLDPSTVFQWTPSSASNTLVSISARANNSAGGTERLVNCFAKDDGSFSLPAGSRAELMPGDTLAVTSIARLARNATVQSGFPVALRRSSNACVR